MVLLLLTAPSAVAQTMAGPSVADRKVCASVEAQSERTFGGTHISAESCLQHVSAIRQKLVAHDVVGAALDIEELNANNALFPSYDGDCQGSINGTYCTPAEWRALKMAVVFSKPDGLRPGAQGFRPLIESFAAERERQTSRLHDSLAEDLAAKDLAATLTAFLELKKIEPVSDDLLASVQGLEMAETLRKDRELAEKNGPKHTDGKSSWYQGRVYAQTRRQRDLSCEEKFVPGARAVMPDRQPLMCLVMKARAVSGDDLDALRAARRDYEMLPPTRRTDLGATLVAKLVPDECPAGMTGTVRLDADIVREMLRSDSCEGCAGNPQGVRTICRATLSQAEMCPNGKVAGDAKHAICIVKMCPPGLTPLSLVRGDLEGCYACPLGAVDLKESLAGNIETGVLCRVGPQAPETMPERRPQHKQHR